MKLLVTGFEPFGGSSANASQLAIESLAAQAMDGIDLAATILPVDRCAAPDTLLAALEKTQPDAVLCLGEAARRAALSIERVAINLLDFRIPDNGGYQPVDEPVIPGGPAAYFVTLPVRRMAEAVADSGVPVELSLTAGTYLCNQVLYTLLHYLAIHKIEIPAGFIHLPPIPEQACRMNPPIPSMCPDTALTGVRAAVQSLVFFVPKSAAEPTTGILENR